MQKFRYFQKVHRCILVTVSETGQCYEVNSRDIYGCENLRLIIDPDGIFEVSVIEAVGFRNTQLYVRCISQTPDLTVH